MKTVNKPFRKKDAMQLVTGQPVYMDDLIPQDCLIVKLLRSLASDDKHEELGRLIFRHYENLKNEKHK